MVVRWPWIQRFVAGVALLGIRRICVICRSRRLAALAVIGGDGRRGGVVASPSAGLAGDALALALLVAGRAGFACANTAARPARAEVATLSTFTRASTRS